MQAAKAAGKFVVAVAALTVLLGLVWAGAWAIFGERWYLYMACQPAFVAAVIFCGVFWIRTRSRTRTVRSFAFFSVASAVGLYLVLCGLHFVRKPPTRFSFLEGSAVAFATHPGVPGYFQMTYSFPDEPKRLMDKAAAELSSLGYAVERRKEVLSARLDMSGADPSNAIVVSIRPGRAVGKHWEVDGDMVDIEKRGDWVTAEVTEPDILPVWVRALLP